ncbi:MAG: DUF2470 domain-containing protein [Sneathiella sp.]|nr:DUF2470 domain-containing protein [Sneathiella sp.]
MAESELNSGRGAIIRHLLRSATTAALATLMPEEKQPYASLVLMATDPSGRPLLLLSDLAVHSRNITRTAEVSLLVSANAPGRDPLTEPRVSLVGTLLRNESEGLKERYLRRYPSARDFAGFADFHLYRMEVARAHLVAGFGEIHWLDAIDFLLPAGFLDDMQSEADILDHMNGDHGAAIQDLAAAGTGGQSRECEMTGIDAEGFDLRRDWSYQRILFENPVSTAIDIRKELVHMVKKARN